MALQVLLQDSPLDGSGLTPILAVLERMREPACALLRGPAASGKSREMSRLRAAIRVDAAWLGHGSVGEIEGLLTRQRSSARFIVLDGLERARPEMVSAVGDFEALCRSRGIALVVVMRDQLPRPPLATLAVDAAVPSWPEQRGVEAKLCGLVARSIGNLEPHDLELLTAFALDAERSGGGCVVPGSGSTRSMSGGIVRARVDRLTHLGVLRRMPAEFGGVLMIASTLVKEYLLAGALLQGHVDARSVIQGDSATATYFAEDQPLVPLLRSLSWCNAAAMSVHLAGARRAEHLEHALRWPPVMAARVLESAASYGFDQEALAKRFSAQLSGTPAPVFERACRVTLLGRAFGGGRQQLVADVASEGLDAVPVTNSQFFAFVDSGGYEDAAFWCEEGWRWRSGIGSSHDVLKHWESYLSSVKAKGLDNVRRERGWRAERFQLMVHLCSLNSSELGNAIEVMMSRSASAPAFWLDSRFNAPMKPVVGVNYYEAEAFCRWQSHVVGRECWLPSLDEWMAAAAGPWSYPWGDVFDSSRANTLEGGLGSTSPVESYGPDISGLYDTCGNVWEWTSTTWRHGDVNKPVGMGFDGVEYKVVKGGSWDNRSSYAVLDVFDVDPCEMFGTRLGFRVNWDRSAQANQSSVS